VKRNKRIQVTRKTVYNLPPNTVYIGRPSIWGNPYKIGVDGDRKEVIEKYRVFLNAKLKTNPYYLDILIGKDLACWCPLNLQCHADVIIEHLEKRLKK